MEILAGFSKFASTIVHWQLERFIDIANWTLYLVAILLLLTGLSLTLLFLLAIAHTSLWLLYYVSNDYLYFLQPIEWLYSPEFIIDIHIFDIYLIFCTCSVLILSFFVLFLCFSAHILSVSTYGNIFASLIVAFAFFRIRYL